MSIINRPSMMSKSRIESFSDGVFSIVLTLLIFNFKIPTISGTDLNQELYSKLFAMYPYCVTYVMSFVLISMFWVAHHNLFHHLKHIDTSLLWLNNLFLLFLAFIPFPTQILGAYYNVESAVVFFGLSMVAVSLSFSLLRYYCYFGGEMMDKNIPENEKRKSLAKSLMGTMFYILALMASVYSDSVSLSMYFLIPFLFFVPVRIGRKLKK